MAKGYFDIKRDIEIEKAGGFFCEACLVGRPLDDQSPDPRYCLGCFDFLLKEVETDSRQGKRTWYPRQGEDTPPNASKNQRGEQHETNFQQH